MINDTELGKWFNSKEYKDELQTVLNGIVRACENSVSEQSTSSAFEERLLSPLYHRFGINVDIEITKEQPIDGIVHTYGSLRERHSGRGRLDAVVNNLIIEYKHFSKLKTERQRQLAYNQVEDYLTALNEKGSKYSAILTDGINIAYFSYLDEEIKRTQLRPLKVDDIDIVLHAILSNNLKKFEPRNIVSDFSISPNSESSSKEIANILFNTLTSRIGQMTPKTQMLFSEWESLMHLSTDDNGRSQDIDKRRRDLGAIFNTVIENPIAEYKALFALQTTYSIIVKLIACKVVDALNLSNEVSVYHELLSLTSDRLQNFFSEMEEGYSYQNMGISNFLEGDFFSWYADKNQWSGSFYNAIRNILAEIDDYTSFAIDVNYNPVDIFKDLYLSIIPQSVRHSMGEYFTPEWLADSVITESLKTIDNENWKAIDPCCGSGIFVISLIKKIVGDVAIMDLDKRQRQAMLNNIVNRAYGIDINPLSVLSARVSYYLAIHKLGEIKDIEIPIYLGDSAIIPQKTTVDSIPCYSYSVNNLKNESIKVVLPVRFVRQKSFGKIMNHLQRLVNAEDTDVLFKAITKNLNAKEMASPELIEDIRHMSEQLVTLHKNNWDGIWIRILTNFMLIARLASFDLIVGNPPWVKWEHLPSAYTQKIKEFCDIRHIFCNDGGLFGGAQLNICALISNVTAANWLSENGVLAFLMPDSIMSQNSYEEFRNFYTDYSKGKRLYLQKIDRWMGPLRPFKVGRKSVSQDFNTYYFSSHEVDYHKGIAVREISKKRVSDFVINEAKTWNTAKKYLIFNNSLARQLSPHSTAFTYMSDKYDFSPIVGKSYYRFRTGVESTPNEVYKLIGQGESERNGHYRFKNDVRKTARYKVGNMPARGWDFPTDYIYPMVQSRYMEPFKFDCHNSFHIIPYDEDNTSEPVSLPDLYDTCPELAEYFASLKDLISLQSSKSKIMHRGSAFYSLSKIGPYTFADNIVAARDNTRFCASIVKPTITPWGDIKKSICVKHTIIISEDTSGNRITEDEAHYVNGVLNSDIVVNYIQNTFKSNGYSLKKAHLFLPKYIKGDTLFEKIVTLSKEATREANSENNADKIKALTKQLGNAYVSLCKKYNKAYKLS